MDLRQHGTLGLNKPLMEYDPHQLDGVYGLLGVSLVLENGVIFIALAPSIPKNKPPSANPTYWQELTLGTGGSSNVPSAGLLEVVYLSNDTNIVDLSKHYVVDTDAGDITLHLPTDATAGEFISAENRGSNTLTLNTTSPWAVETGTVTINAGEYYALSADTVNKVWKITSKEVEAVIGSVSHLVGFYDDDGFLKVDVYPLVGDTEYDVTKYNLFFMDGTPAWRIINESVDFVVNNTTYNITLT